MKTIIFYLSSLKNHKKNEKEQLKVALNNESGSLCKILNMSLDYGVAYHHSGIFEYTYLYSCSAFSIL